MTRKVDVAIIGAGTAGLAAMAQVRRKTDNFVIIDGGELGTTCARVGCMPSKALIQIAEDFHHRRMFARQGITGADGLGIDRPAVMERVESLRDILVDRVLSHTIDTLGDEFIADYAHMLSVNRLMVGEQEIEARATVLAVGSRPIIPEPWRQFGDRILTTDQFFELDDLPESVAVIGLGAIGLELGQSMSRLGVEVTALDVLDRIAGIDDEAVNKQAVDLIGKEFPLWLGERADIEASGDQLKVSTASRSVIVDKVLVSMGRRSNLDSLSLEKIDLELDANGIPHYDLQTMQIGSEPVFIAGDANALRPVLHEASLEGRIAGYNAVAESVIAFHRPTRLLIAFSDPNICAVGCSLSELNTNEFVVGEFRYGPLGRALVMGNNQGIMRLYVDKKQGYLLGAAIAAPRAEHLAHLLAWSIERHQTVFEMLQMPFYHPVFEEALQAALRDAIAKIGITMHHPPEIRPVTA